MDEPAQNGFIGTDPTGLSGDRALQFRGGEDPMAYDCTVRTLRAQPSMAVRRVAPVAEAGPAVVEAFTAVGQYLHEHGGRPAGETYARFLSIDPESVQVEVGFTVEELLPAEGDVQPGELPAGEVVVTLHQGPYEQLPEATAALQAWMRANGRQAAGAAWEVYLNGPPDVTEPEQFETEVFMPLVPLASAPWPDCAS